MLDSMSDCQNAPESPAGSDSAAAASAQAPGEAAASAALQALMRLGAVLAWGLFALGLLRGAEEAVRRVSDGHSGGVGSMLAVLAALTTALSWGLAGWALAIACRLAGAITIARIERASRSDETYHRLAERAASAMERMAEARLSRQISEAPGTSSTPEFERRRLLSEIEQAERDGRWDDARSLLAQLDDRFPGDPAIPAVRERLDAARREDVEGHLARIDAARQVNDPATVLELYRSVGSGLESPRRLELERQLAAWFRELIFRRLRVGRIQVDVVHLATQVAETFAGTVDGASLKASLPTLRRSVGLCPRCAQPYTGLAAACPRCLTGLSAPPEPQPAESDDDVLDPD
jgi:hypothetical protein